MALLAGLLEVSVIRLPSLAVAAEALEVPAGRALEAARLCEAPSPPEIRMTAMVAVATIAASRSAPPSRELGVEVRGCSAESLAELARGVEGRSPPSCNCARGP